MKYTKNSNAPTLIKEGKEKRRVSKILCKLFILLNNFKSLVTLKTLITLINYGPTLKKDNPDPIESKIISTIELATTNKSN